MGIAAPSVYVFIQFKLCNIVFWCGVVYRVDCLFFFLNCRARQVNHARNIWDRAVTILPRANQFWYKYTYMEEMLGNVAGCRQVYSFETNIVKSALFLYGCFFFNSVSSAYNHFNTQNFCPLVSRNYDTLASSTLSYEELPSP